MLTESVPCTCCGKAGGIRAPLSRDRSREDRAPHCCPRRPPQSARPCHPLPRPTLQPGGCALVGTAKS